MGGKVRERKRPSGRRRWATQVASSTILVASFLVVNAPQPVQAVPFPLLTPSNVDVPFEQRARGQLPAVLSQLDTSRVMDLDRDSYDASDQIRDLHDFSRIEPYNDGDEGEIYGRILGLGTNDEKPTPTLLYTTRDKRDVSAATSTRVNAASFTSILANSWNPGSRSVWFQRKAVIITSIFLAIFIVLTIGCVVFLRGKREDDLDEEYDVSDEAALARMREERDMRLGSRSEKKKAKKRRKKDDGSLSSTRGEGAGVSTAIVASKWARLPTRKIRLRKTKSKDSSSNDEKISGNDSSENNNPSSLSLSAEAENDFDVQAGSQVPAATDRNANEETVHEPESPRQSGSREGHATANGSTNSNASSPNIARRAERLNAADLVYAEEEEERLGLGDALPPAYIPSRDLAASRATVSRPLAGQEDTLAEARGDIKRNDGAASSGTSPPTASSLVLAQPAVHDATSSSRRAESPMAGAIPSVRRFDAHVATDDKAILAEMRQAVSHPDETPRYAASPPFTSQESGPSAVDTGSTSANLASAPALPDDDDVPAELLHSTSAKGKDAHGPSSSASRLPAPPARQEPVAFSHFDLPYHSALASRDRIGPSRHPAPSPLASTSASEEKAREAAAEEERAMAILESQPEDVRSLPRYQPGSEESAVPRPSAPPHFDDDDDDDDHDEPAPQARAQVAPSAPLADGDDV